MKLLKELFPNEFDDNVKIPWHIELYFIIAMYLFRYMVKWHIPGLKYMPGVLWTVFCVISVFAVPAILFFSYLLIF